MKLLATIVLLAIGVVLGHPSPFGILDGVVENILEQQRPALAGLVLPDLNVTLNSSGIIGQLITTNITTNKLDNFTVEALKTTLLPLRLDILTLHWEEVTLFGLYSLEGSIDLDILQGPVYINGEGNASIALRNLTLTAGATISSPGGHLAIKEITQLSVQLGESNVILEEIFDGGDMDLVINVFLSFFLRDFVNDSGDEVLEMLEPVIIEKVNEILAGVDFP